MVICTADSVFGEGGCSVPAVFDPNDYISNKLVSYNGGFMGSERNWKSQWIRERSGRSSTQSADIVEVAFDGTKEIKSHAVEWALKNVVQAGDMINVVAVVQETSLISCSTWGFTGECAFGTRTKNSDELEERIQDACQKMLHQLQKLQDEKRVRIKLRVIADGTKGIPALQAQRMNATWVILDRNLRHEGKACLEKLQCNVVVVNHSGAQILRLNLKRSPRTGQGSTKNKSPTQSSLPLVGDVSNTIEVFKRFEVQERYGAKKSTYNDSVSDQSMQTTSPEDAFTSTDLGTTVTSSSASGTSLCSPLWPDLEPITPLQVFSQTGANSASNFSSTSMDYGWRESSSDSENDRPNTVKKIKSKSPPLEVSSSSKLPNDESLFSASQPTARRSTSRASHDLSGALEGRNVFTQSGALRGASSKSEPLSHEVNLLKTAQNFSGQMDDTLRHRYQATRNHSSRPVADSRAFASNERTTMSDLFAFSNEGLDMINPASTVGPKVYSPKLLNGVHVPDKEVTASVSCLDVASKLGFNIYSNLRQSMSLSRQAPPGPPPLCSICQHKSPNFGRPPQSFSYEDLRIATDGFSKVNFLAEGGFGSVFRGVLSDGQTVAVKQLKLASSQGDDEFLAEVEVLSCAQQRNVVTLIGYCIEESRRLLVYEFVCNGSLDTHLYGQKRPLEWQARHKIAVGTARGLRYLHEECRVGCIIHRDMRPNNILLTHDFEPMVGDFGLARWQPNGALGVETRVIGTFGYLAPEYAQSGQITEKADVYAFGIVLLELVTGQKVIDLSRPKGQQCLTEWAKPYLETHQYHEMVDTRLLNHYNDYEMYCMLQTARLCICQNPDFRPRMSQVLRMLEGDVTLDTSGAPVVWSSRHDDPFSFWC